MRGTYILFISVKKEVFIRIGALKKIKFTKGIYTYIGSALARKGSSSLINRVQRHLKSSNEKNLHWHIDYLLANENVKIAQIYLLPSPYKFECTLAREFHEIAVDHIKGFGSTDCKCRSHLFYFKTFENVLKSLID
jgi:Uri superfamily endonuclease